MEDTGHCSERRCLEDAGRVTRALCGADAEAFATVLSNRRGTAYGLSAPNCPVDYPRPGFSCRGGGAMGGRKGWLEKILWPYRGDRRAASGCIAYRLRGAKVDENPVRDISATGAFVVT